MTKFYSTMSKYPQLRVLHLLLSLVSIMSLAPAMNAQIYRVSISSYPACGGVTIVPQCYYSTQAISPVTIYYEKSVGAGTWGLEATQVYNNKTSYIKYNGSSLTTAANFRVRAIDEITGQEYISNSVSVNPATWNQGRGTALSIPTAYWSASCAGAGYIEVANYFTSQGRPPFNVAYKKSSEANYVSVGETTNAAIINGIEPWINYDIRVTDECGSISYSSTKLVMLGDYSVDIPATNCNDGQVTLLPETDSRYAGIPPYKYALFKLNETYNEDAFTINNVFQGLGKSTYKYYIKDACGNVSTDATLSLGNGAPGGYGTTAVAVDSCFTNITLHATSGTKPISYGLRFFGSVDYTYQSDSVFQIPQHNTGAYDFKLVSACGDTSQRLQVYVTGKRLMIDSVTYLNTGCLKDVIIHVSGAYGPYQYGTYVIDSGRYVFRPSDTIRNMQPNLNNVIVRDRCGAENSVFVNFSGCSVSGSSTEFESKNSAQGCANLSGTGWIDLHDDNNNLIYSINPNGNLMNDVCWGVKVVQNNGSIRSDTINGVISYFLDRNFYIEPPANITLTDSVSIRLYFTDEELRNMLNYLMNNANLYNNPEDLKILKKKGSAGSPVDLNVVNDGNAAGSQFTIIYPTIRHFGDNWLMEFKVKDFSEFNTFLGEYTALPLNFMEFTAAGNQRSVKLNWATTGEVDTKDFNVQWSRDGIVFNNIGTVPARNQSQVNQYSFSHANPDNGINYYRLKQNDHSGRYTFSKTIRAIFESEKEVRIFPNPAQEQLLIKLSGNNLFKSLDILDATGKIILHKSIQSGMVEIDLDIHAFAKGLYIISLDGTVQQYIRFIKN